MKNKTIRFKITLWFSVSLIIVVILSFVSFMTVSIVSPSAAAVKPRRHPRFRREDIPAPEIDPVLKAFGRHIARSFHRGRGVHIPAMKNTAFGQVLRTLELKRAFN